MKIGDKIKILDSRYRLVENGEIHKITDIYEDLGYCFITLQYSFFGFYPSEIELVRRTLPKGFKKYTKAEREI